MLKGKTVWINGASTGIGKALAVEVSAKGANLILSSRKEDKLNEVKAFARKTMLTLKFMLWI